MYIRKIKMRFRGISSIYLNKYLSLVLVKLLGMKPKDPNAEPGIGSLLPSLIFYIDTLLPTLCLYIGNCYPKKTILNIIVDPRGGGGGTWIEISINGLSRLTKDSRKFWLFLGNIDYCHQKNTAMFNLSPCRKEKLLRFYTFGPEQSIRFCSR